MKITIIGCGTMGKGFAQRLSASCTLFFYDRHVEKAEYLQQKGYGKACHRVEDALEQSEVIILAVKPQGFAEVAKLIDRKPPANQMLISLLTGIPIARIEERFPHHRVIRMMPNLALIYGEGLIGLTTGIQLTKKEKKQLLEICGPLGKVYWLEETKINAFTALAGSGPAFVFTLIESMVDAGIAMGFSAKDAQEIVQQMIKGSLHLLDNSGQHPGELKWQIASPGGTTIAGLRTLEELGVRGGIINTFFSAYERANELSRCQ
jgi:pyrroline-5-carboxylate reductase